MVETADVSTYKVMTMCHCDERSDDGEPTCDDHWAVGVPTGRFDEESGHVGMAKDMTEGFRTRDDAQLFADAKNGWQPIGKPAHSDPGLLSKGQGI